MAPLSIDLRSRVLRDSEARDEASKDVAAKSHRQSGVGRPRETAAARRPVRRPRGSNRSFAGACWLGRKIAWPR